MNTAWKSPLAGAALAALFVQGAWAQAADEGRLLASGCFQCHGTNGVKGAFGTLAGSSKKDLVDKLNDLRRKSARSNIMAPHARGYTPRQIELIAEYFARQPKP
ncbi:c-type cytochrome [Inhella proteolytica]|uniref:Class I cytochrome c n=1 Tax=Inhella proteolytica TaxID=2795029 RepID=A0A931J589_9BURK|nr:class I cytochrome c [Inhella proteolytica]MBH9576577.1 class I cytochrome c [Inhella proteolytica]